MGDKRCACEMNAKVALRASARSIGLDRRKSESLAEREIQSHSLSLWRRTRSRTHLWQLAPQSLFESACLCIRVLLKAIAGFCARPLSNSSESQSAKPMPKLKLEPNSAETTRVVLFLHVTSI